MFECCLVRLYLSVCLYISYCCDARHTHLIASDITVHLTFALAAFVSLCLLVRSIVHLCVFI